VKRSLVHVDVRLSIVVASMDADCDHARTQAESPSRREPGPHDQRAVPHHQSWA